MKASEVIKLLQVAKAQYGDLECATPEGFVLGVVKIEEYLELTADPSMLD